MIQLRSFAEREVPSDIELYQLSFGTTPTCHVYMEAQIFSPDSKRFLIHSSATPHGGGRDSPEHRYILCDLENNGELTPVTDERGGVAQPAISPDGKTMYYFVDEALTNGRVFFKKYDLETRKREIITCIEQPQDGRRFAGSFSSKISPDGKRIAAEIYWLPPNGIDGVCDFAIWIFDVATGKFHEISMGADYCNPHLQYCHDPSTPHAILVQHNHGCRHYHCSASSKVPNASYVAALDKESDHHIRAIKLGTGAAASENNTGYGIDLHIIDDDGTNWRTLPMGRDGREFGQGHECWRGRTQSVISSTLLFKTPSTANQELVELLPMDGQVHFHNITAGGRRSVLSRNVPVPHFLHFATDAAGDKIVSDYEADNGEWHLYTGELGSFGEAADMKMILNLGSRKVSPDHPHPFMSPNGKWVFFNSAASGTLQAYGVKL